MADACPIPKPRAKTPVGDTQFNLYAVTSLGRDMLKARTLDDALREVKADRYLSKATREIVKITKETLWNG